MGCREILFEGPHQIFTFSFNARMPLNSSRLESMFFNRLPYGKLNFFWMRTDIHFIKSTVNEFWILR